MTQPTRSIIDYLSEIEDSLRDNANIRHDFTDILIIALCDTLSGADDWVAIAEYRNEKKEWFAQF